jgi:hypothetical protein
MKKYNLISLVAALALIIGACGSNNNSTNTNTIDQGGTSGMTAAAGTSQTQVTGQGGQTVATTTGTGGIRTTAGTGVAGSAGTSATAGKAGAGTSGAGGASGSGVAGKAGAAGASGSAGRAGAAGSPPAACVSALKAGCKTRSTDSCSSFIVPTATALDTTVKDGATLELGPYGAIMEPNVGKGFEVSLSASDTDGGCLIFAQMFAEPNALNQDLMDSKGTDLTLHTVYRPACMIDGEKYPILVWGNGTCAKPEGYGALLRYIASYGFFVFAPNSRYVGMGNNAMGHALDFAFAAAGDSSSPYYNRLDTTKVGAAGHSQGCQETAVQAAGDDRIQTVILYNMSSSASKPFLAMSGDNDLSGQSVTQMAGALATSTVPGAYMFFHKVPMTGTYSGHLTLMRQPERLAPASVGWLKYQFYGDATSRALFVGDSCGLCGQDADFVYAQKGLQ